MNVGLALRKAKTKIDSLDAELLLVNVLKIQDRSELVLREDEELSNIETTTYFWMVDRREKGEPLAYIVGYKEFYGRKFKVNSKALIPRPESEDIIELVKKLDKKKILDVGTGSGCLAVTLALEIPNAKITGVDISKDALFVAANNAIELGAKVSFVQSDLMKKLDKNESFDVIVANLPYVDISWPWKGKELDWEPGLALYAGDSGLEIIKKMIIEAKNRTEFLVIEADPSQHEMIKEYSENNEFTLYDSKNYILVFRAN